MERVTGLMLRFAKPNPPSQAQSGEFLKTLHWSVFLTEFHLIGSSPCSCSNGKRQRVCSVAARLSMERVTGLEPANTSLGSSGLTTWRHPHQVSDYTLCARKGVERFQKVPYSTCFPRRRGGPRFTFVLGAPFPLPLCFLRLRGFLLSFPRVSGPLVDVATTKYLHSATSAIIEQKTSPIREFHQRASHENHPERRAVTLRRR